MLDDTSVRDRIWAFDLAPVTRRLERRGIRAAPRLEEEFRRLAYLWHVHRGVWLAPSRTVDEYLHEAILDTNRFRDFCLSIYGGMVEHVPDDTFSGMWDDYRRTLDVYQAEFGEPDPSTWGPVGANSMGRAPH